MLEPDLSRQASQFLDSLNLKQARQVVACIDRLCLNPFRPNSKKLQGIHPPCFRYRVGTFRVVYEVDQANSILRVILIEKRGDDEVYRLLERKSR